MTITKRATKGSALTHDELDANFTHFEDMFDVLETVTAKAADYTALTTDTIILADATSADVDITLLSPVSGKNLIIKKTDSSVNSVFVLPSASETIDGEASIELQAEGDVISLTTDGTNWYSI